MNQIIFPESPPELPTDCVQILNELGLPEKIEIECYNKITITFSGTITMLSTIWKRDLDRGFMMGEMPKDWNRFWHIADQEYLQGGGWICIEEKTGKLFVIDLDQTEPIYLINASVQNFHLMLSRLIQWSENTKCDHDAILALKGELQLQNEIPQDELEPFWINIIEATLDQEEPYFSLVLCNRANEK